MKNAGKKILAMSLGVFLLTSMLPASVFAAQDGAAKAEDAAALTVDADADAADAAEAQQDETVAVTAAEEESTVAEIEFLPLPRFHYARDAHWFGTMNGDRVIVTYKDGTQENFVYDLSAGEFGAFVSEETGKTVMDRDDDESMWISFDAGTQEYSMTYMGVTDVAEGAAYFAKEIAYEQTEPYTIKESSGEIRYDSNDEAYTYYDIQEGYCYQEGDTLIVTYENNLGETRDVPYAMIEDAGSCFRMDIGDGRIMDNSIMYYNVHFDLPDQETEHLQPGESYGCRVHWEEVIDEQYENPVLVTEDAPFNIYIKPAAIDEPGKVENPRIDSIDRYGISYTWDDFTPPEGEEVQGFQLTVTYQGKQVVESYLYGDGSEFRKIKIYIYDIIEGIAAEPGKDYTIDLVLSALNGEMQAVGSSDPFTVTISLKDVKETLIPIELPDTILIGGWEYISAPTAKEEYTWSAEGSEPMVYLGNKTVGAITEITSSKPAVIAPVMNSTTGTIKGLAAGSSKITVKYTYNGIEKSIAKTIRVPEQYLRFSVTHEMNLDFASMAAGTSKTYEIHAALYKYNSAQERYLYAGDVTDSTTFSVPEDKIMFYDYSSDEWINRADKIKAAVSGNKLTLTPDKSLNNGQMSVSYIGSGAGASGTGTVSIDVMQRSRLIKPVKAFQFPYPGKSAKLDLKLESYDKGTAVSEKPSYIKAYFSNASVKGADAKTFKSGDKIMMDQLPLTIKNTLSDVNGTASIRFEAYDADDTYLSWLSFTYNGPFDGAILNVKSSVTYTGKALKPAPTLMYGTTELDLADYSIEYYNNKSVGTATVRVVQPNTGSAKTATFQIVPPAPAISKVAAEAAGKGLTVTWGKVTGSTGYKVYRDGKAVATVKGTTNVTWTDTAAKTNGTKYVYKIRAYKTVSGKNYYSGYSAGKSYIFLSRPAIKSLANSAAGTLTVKWNKNAKASGYQIQYALNSKFTTGKTTVKITGAATVSKAIKKLTKGKTYYVRIRAYNGSNYSAWSAVKKLKLTK